MMNNQLLPFQLNDSPFYYQCHLEQKQTEKMASPLKIARAMAVVFTACSFVHPVQADILY